MALFPFADFHPQFLLRDDRRRYFFETGLASAIFFYRHAALWRERTAKDISKARGYLLLEIGQTLQQFSNGVWRIKSREL